MGAFIAVVMLGLLSWAVVCLCIRACRIVIKDKLGLRESQPTPERPVRHHRKRGPPKKGDDISTEERVAQRKTQRSFDQHLEAFIDVISMQGYFEASDADSIEYVDDAILAKMLEKLDTEATDDLMWHLPSYDLYVVAWKKPSNPKYRYGVKTPSGAVIGYGQL